MKLNSDFRGADLGETNKKQLEIGPTDSIALGVRLLQWRLPSLIRFMFGKGTFKVLSKYDSPNCSHTL